MAQVKGLAEKNKARQQWFWQKNRLSKPPLLHEAWRKGYARIPYEKMHQDEQGYYIDANDPFELTTLAIKNPRYFDAITMTRKWRLRKHPKSRLYSMSWILWLAVGLNAFFAGVNMIVTALKLFR